VILPSLAILNAGLPNPMSETGFDETPEITSRLIEDFQKTD
jgi:5-methyltetrahydrofolate--homocysteine methyltransferase